MKLNNKVKYCDCCKIETNHLTVQPTNCKEDNTLEICTTCGLVSDIYNNTMIPGTVKK